MHSNIIRCTTFRANKNMQRAYILHSIQRLSSLITHIISSSSLNNKYKTYISTKTPTHKSRGIHVGSTGKAPCARGTTGLTDGTSTSTKTTRRTVNYSFAVTIVNTVIESISHNGHLHQHQELCYHKIVHHCLLSGAVFVLVCSRQSSKSN